jgi:hypothetical protein
MIVFIYKWRKKYVFLTSTRVVQYRLHPDYSQVVYFRLRTMQHATHGEPVFKTEPTLSLRFAPFRLLCRLHGEQVRV